MCETHGHLLEENRLLLAVLQLQELDDRRNCLYLADLTEATADSAPAIQSAIEKGRNPSKRPRKPPPNAAQTASGPLRLQMDLAQTRLSTILKLKSLLRSAPGRTPVIIDFHQSGRPVSRLSIGEAWGVQPTPGLLQQLTQLCQIAP